MLKAAAQCAAAFSLINCIDSKNSGVNYEGFPALRSIQNYSLHHYKTVNYLITNVKLR